MPMRRATRTFRLFVSSTFSDLKAERDALQERVFPRLRDLCRAHGASFQAIDLRWGISREAAEDQQTMRICLGEIDRCRQVTERPNFIVMLGDRYGWRPVSEEIPADELEEILSYLNGGDGRSAGQAILSQWYRRDDNAVPTMYRLLPHEGAHEDDDPWRTVERDLSRVLRSAAAALGFPPERRRRYVASATEQEIAHRGLFDHANGDESVFCFFRRIEALPEDQQAEDFLDLDDQGRPDTDARALLEDLKARLRQRLPGSVHEYVAEWTEIGPSTHYIDQLCSDVYKCLSDVIRNELFETTEIDPLDAEIAAHREFGEDRINFFVGRTAPIRVIKDYLKGPSSYPLVICGESGSGKSTLMARVIADVIGAVDAGAVVFRFIGAVPGSTNIRTLLEGICRQLRRRYGDGEATASLDYPDLIRDFREQLASASEQRPLILFLDAVDQLAGLRDDHGLAWLPAELPKYVHIIVTTLPGDRLEAPARRIPESHRYELLPMASDEGDTLLHLWLEDAGRALQYEQSEQVLNAFQMAHGFPLYLRLAFEQARLWRSDSPRVELASSVPGLIRALFARLSEDANHGDVLVSRSLSYLVAGKNGLSQDELLDVLSADREVMADFRERSPQSPRVDTLPVVVWSRLYFDLAPYLTSRSADAMTTLDFFHRQLREVVEADYLTGDTKRERHRALARHFGEQPYEQAEADQKAPNLRKLSELPFQLARGEMWEMFGQTLLDFTFLQTKVSAVGPQSVIEDFDLPSTSGVSTPTADVVGDLEHLTLVQSSLKLSSHILSKDPNQLSGQLLGRLIPDSSDKIRKLLESAATWGKAAWLRPLTPSLLHPGGPLQRVISIGSTGGETVGVTPDGQQIIAPSEHNVLKVWDLETGAEVRILRGHTDLVRTLAITADGKRVVSTAEDKNLKVWDLASGDVLQSLQPPGLSALAVAVAPEGQWAICALEEHPLIVWEPGSGKAPRRFRGHTGLVRSIAITRDGCQAISSSWDQTLRLWDLGSGTTIRLLDGEISGEAVAITPDGKLALAASRDCSIKIWDLHSGHIVGALEGHDNVIRSISVTPNGRLAVSASRDKTLKVWDLESRTLVRTLIGHTDEVGAVAFLPTGDTLVSADRRLKVWDLVRGEVLCTLERHDNLVESIAVSPDGRLAVSTSGGQELKVWDLESGTEVRILAHVTHPASAVAISGDGKLVISAENALSIWDLNRAQCLEALRKREISGEAVAISADGRVVISTSTECPLRMLDLTTGNTIRTLRGHTRTVKEIVVTRDARRTLSAAWDRTIKVWDLNTGRSVRTLRGHGILGEAVALSPDEQFALVPCEDNTAKLWDLRSGRIAKSLMGHSEWTDAVAFTPDGKRALTASRDRTLMLWDLDSGESVLTLRGHTNSVGAVAVTPDSCRAVSTSFDQTIRVWDLSTRRGAAAASSHTDFVRAVAITPDGALAITASDDGTLRTWDVSSGAERRTLRGHEGEVWAVAITPDSRHAVSGARDRTLRIWDLRSGKAVKTLQGHEEAITAIVITPDGQRAVSASYDETVRLWDLATGRALYTFVGHVNLVTDLALTPDGRLAVSASMDSMVKVWDLDCREAPKTLEGHRDCVQAVTVTPNGKWAVSCGMNDDCIRVWDLRTGEAVKVLHGLGHSYGSISVTPSGNKLIAASDDTWDPLIEGWDITTWDKLLVIPKPHNDVNLKIVITPNEQSIISVSMDHTLKLWDINQGNLIAAFSSDGGLVAAAVTPDGKAIITAGESGQVHALRLQGV